MRLEYKKVVVILLLIIFHSQTSLSQTRNSDLYKTFKTITKGVVEEAFRFPAGEGFGWLYTYYLINKRETYEKEMSQGRCWNVITMGRLPDGTRERLPEIHDIVMVKLKHYDIRGGVLFSFYYDEDGKIFFTEIMTRPKLNLNNPNVRQAVQKVLCSCDTIRFPSLSAEYDKRFLGKKNNNNSLKDKGKLYFGWNIPIKK
jgi:hypothetical protein